MVQEIVKNLDFLVKASDYLQQPHDIFTQNLELGQEIKICKTLSCQATAPVMPLKTENERQSQHLIILLNIHKKRPFHHQL